MVRLTTILALVIVAILVGPAQLMAGPDATRAAADALFAEGIKLRDAGQHEQACDRFQRSQKLDPARGTLYNIGLCLERQEKLASSLAAFQLLLDQAETAGDRERIVAARKHLSAIGPRVPTLSISLEEGAAMAGLEILHNGVVVQKSLFGFAAPVDPGLHTIVAQAPEHKSWEVEIEIAERAVESIEIPALTPMASEDGASSARLTSKTPGTVATNGAGQVALVVGPALLNEKAIDTPLSGNVSARATLEVAGNESLSFGLGVQLGYTRVSWTSRDESPDGTTQLFTALVMASVVKNVTSRLALVAQAGGGALVFVGLDKPGNPLVEPGMRAVGAIESLQVRGSLGLDYRVGNRLSILLSPVVVWWSPRRSGIDRGLGSLVGLQSTLGLGYRF